MTGSVSVMRDRELYKCCKKKDSNLIKYISINVMVDLMRKGRAKVSMHLKVINKM